MMTSEQKANELINNKEFLHDLAFATSPEQLGEVLEANHLKLEGTTLEDVFADIQAQNAKAKDGELDEAQLELVSGGGLSWLAAGIKAAVVSGQAATWCSVCGPVILGLAAFALAKYAYNKMKKR